MVAPAHGFKRLSRNVHVTRMVNQDCPIGNLRKCFSRDARSMSREAAPIPEAGDSGTSLHIRHCGYILPIFLLDGKSHTKTSLIQDWHSFKALASYPTRHHPRHRRSSKSALASYPTHHHCQHCTGVAVAPGRVCFTAGHVVQPEWSAV